jgi:hypothetical protein
MRGRRQGLPFGRMAVVRHQPCAISLIGLGNY